MVKRNVCVLYTDASVYNNGQRELQDAYYAVVLEDGTEEGLLLRHRRIGNHSVNEAEYRGVLAALAWLHDEDIDRPAVIITDSQLVYGHVMKDWRCKMPSLRRYRDRVRHLISATGAEVIWKPREENKAGWFFQGIVDGRRKEKYRKKKEAKRAKRRIVREWTIDNPEVSGYTGGQGTEGNPRLPV